MYLFACVNYIYIDKCKVVIKMNTNGNKLYVSMAYMSC